MARRRRKRSFGVLTHRHASSARVGGGDRSFTVKVEIHRNIGASRERFFCSHAYIPKKGRARRAAGYRYGPTACASTPTVAAKRALRLFVGKNWS